MCSSLSCAHIDTHPHAHKCPFKHKTNWLYAMLSPWFCLMFFGNEQKSEDRSLSPALISCWTLRRCLEGRWSLLLCLGPGGLQMLKLSYLGMDVIDWTSLMGKAEKQNALKSETFLRKSFRCWSRFVFWILISSHDDGQTARLFSIWLCWWQLPSSSTALENPVILQCLTVTTSVRLGEEWKPCLDTRGYILNLVFVSCR